MKLIGLRKLFILPIKFYQRYISPAFGRRCKYYPTCSGYAVQAIGRHGIFKGTLLATWRILRCNPYSAGGIDEVPAQGKWKPAPAPTYAQLVAEHDQNNPKTRAL